MPQDLWNFFLLTNISIAKTPKPKFHILVGNKKAGFEPPILINMIFKIKLNKVIKKTIKNKKLLFLNNFIKKINIIGIKMLKLFFDSQRPKMKQGFKLIIWSKVTTV